MNNYNQDGLHFNETDSKPEPRPGFLTFLCILTFIGSGFSVLSQLFSYIYYDKIPILFEQVASVMGGQLEEAYLEMAEIFIAIPRYYFIVLLAVYALAVVGAFICLFEENRFSSLCYKSNLIVGITFIDIAF